MTEKIVSNASQVRDAQTAWKKAADEQLYVAKSGGRNRFAG